MQVCVKLVPDFLSVLQESAIGSACILVHSNDIDGMCLSWISNMGQSTWVYVNTGDVQGLAKTLAYHD